MEHNSDSNTDTLCKSKRKYLSLYQLINLDGAVMSFLVCYTALTDLNRKPAVNFKVANAWRNFVSQRNIHQHY